MKVLVIDNYDSFTYNLVHYLEKLVEEVVVYRNDEIQWDQVETFDKIILSPGPGLPEESGDLLRFIETYKFRKPILGVCLGHQALAQSFGGKLFNLHHPYHGKAVEINITSPSRLYHKMELPVAVGLYHSWAVDAIHLPDEFRVTAEWNGIIMSMEHVNLPLVSVQFHPESILSNRGMTILKNFVERY